MTSNSSPTSAYPSNQNNAPYPHNIGQTEPVDSIKNFSNIENSYNQAKNINDAEKGHTNLNGGWGDLGGISEKVLRIKFVRKVYLIVCSQLIFTFGICAIFVTVDSVKKFARSNTGLYFYYASYIIYIILSITFSVCQCTKGLRKVPYNYMLLGGITLSLTYMLGMISAYFDIQAVFIAISITLFITIGVTLFSMQTKYDFTNCWLVLICLTFALLGFGISCAFVGKYYPIMQAVYGGLGAILMALFLAIDTQLIVGGKQYAYDTEDYINAALQLYLDICLIFLYILQLLGAVKK